MWPWSSQKIGFKRKLSWKARQSAREWCTKRIWLLFKPSSPWQKEWILQHNNFKSVLYLMCRRRGLEDRVGCTRKQVLGFTCRDWKSLRSRQKWSSRNWRDTERENELPRTKFASSSKEDAENKRKHLIYTGSDNENVRGLPAGDAWHRLIKNFYFKKWLARNKPLETGNSVRSVLPKNLKWWSKAPWIFADFSRLCTDKRSNVAADA